MRVLALVVVLLGCGAKPNLLGDGGGGEAAPSSASLTISPDSVDLSSPLMTAQLTVTNTGTDPTELIGFEIMGTDSTSFAIASTSCTTLTPNASCTVDVRLTLHAVGTVQAMLHVTAGQAETDATLNGVGVMPSSGLTITAPPNDFAITAVKNDSPALVFTITNTSTQPSGALIVQLDTSNPQFTVAMGNTCSGVLLAPAHTCTVPIAFSPRGSGAVMRMGLLTVRDQNLDTATTQLVAKTGQIARPSSTSNGTITGSACAAPMGNAQVTFTNETWTGTAMSIVLNGNNVDSFKLVTDCMPTLASGATCTATVAAVATDSPVPVTTMTNLVVNASQGAASASLSPLLTGNLGPCDLQVTPRSLMFGSVAAGTNPPITQSFTVTNTSTSTSYPVTTSPVAGLDPGDFVVMSDGCTGRMLSPAPTGGPCTVVLELLPQVVGPRTAQVSVTTPGLAPPPVQLSGTGIASGLTVMPGTLTFVTAPGVAAPTQTVTVTTTVPAGLLGITVPPPFLQSAGTNCPTFGPGTPCVITVGYLQATVGMVQKDLTITSAVGGALVTLKGTAQ